MSPEKGKNTNTVVTAAGAVLPAAYIERMKKLLGDGFGQFALCMEEPAVKGLRFNAKKVRPETLERLVKEWALEPVPWCGGGYYYGAGENGKELRPGLSPWHAAGVFYIQEPSAMLTAASAGIKESDTVLDLCAAPGGKTSAAAERAGLLVSNEYVEKRARILSSNVERMGYGNVIVTNASPGALSEALNSFFDKVIVDAPCSGEGMMRRDPVAVSEWSEENVKLCAGRQREILSEAVKLLKPGGRLIYSTCTFENCENGEQAEFLCREYGFRLVSMETIYPHLVRGEGHFCAVLEKPPFSAVPADMDAYAEESIIESRVPGDAPFPKSAASRCAGTLGSISEPRSCRPFPSSFKNSDVPGTHALSEEVAVGAAERPIPELRDVEKKLRRAGIHVLRAGVEKGTVVKGKHRGEERYEPSHAEAMAARYEETEGSIDLKREEDALKYLRGESLDLLRIPEEAYVLKGSGGFLVLFFDGYPLGWCKLVGKTLKNHYPKGLRHLS